MDESGKVSAQNKFIGGISDYDKEGAHGTYVFGRSVDHRSNSRELTLLPKTTKESATTITGLPLWADRVGDTTYIYDDTGNLYTRSLQGSYSLVRSVSNSSGNGLRYYGEDDFLYYTTNTTLGRYGQVTNSNATPTYVDDFLGAEGGVPANTNSLDLEASSSQYADAADSASLSIVSDLALEAYIKPESLPSVGNSMTLIGKWDESASAKSYKLEIKTVAGYFGDGSDSSLTISTNTTQSPKDATCTGTSGSNTLTFASASGTFVTGEIVLVHQSRGTGAGTWMRSKINGVSGTTSGTLTLEDPLNADYASGAQVLVLKQYTDVTIDAGVSYLAKAWDGSKGGILAFLYSGTLTVNGTLSAGTASIGDGYNTNNQGFRGATTLGGQGEGTAGDRNTISTAANGSGGGGGAGPSGGAAGGGHASAGTNGTGSGGVGGSASGSSDLTTLTFGGGGGRGNDASLAGEGGFGGGAVFTIGSNLVVNPTTGLILANGSNGQSGGSPTGSGGGGGAGGSIFLKYQTGTLGTDRLSARGGLGGASGNGAGNGGAGSDGRIHIDYSTSTSGSSTYPALTTTLDGSLVSTTSYQWRLGISNDGTAEEYLTKNAMALVTNAWIRISVSWVASTSTVSFFENAQPLGTITGTKTSIHNNASLLYIGANKGASTVQNFFDGKIDDIRIWNTTRTSSEFSTFKDRELVGTESGLVAYYELDNADTDKTGNSNDLTLRNSPTYSTDVPFSAATTRLDIDQSLDTSGNTYTLGTSVNENVAHRQTFVPAKDPQKSIGVNFGTKGTGDVTLVVHDSLNRLVATKTVTNAALPASGAYEFIFDDTWTPVIGASYHFHLYSTVADATVVTTTSNDLETAEFFTYYQFLVSNPFHPIENMLNFQAVGNGRYLATYDAAAGYNPHRLILPAGWSVRCLTKWRDFLVLGLTKGDYIYSYDQGLLIFWDGVSTTYNDYRFVPEGAINSILGAQDDLWIVAGYLGDLLKYIGGGAAKKIKRIPKVTEAQYLEVMPSALTMWKTLLRIGFSGTSDSDTIERGVYSFGALNPEHPQSFSYDYPISTGNRTATNIKIGLVFPVDRKLLIGWKDNTANGIDVVSPSGQPFATGTVESPIMDAGGLWKEKLAPFARAEFKPLRSGESITIKYKLDRADQWTSLTQNTVGETTVKIPIAKGRHREVQIATDLATSGTTSPTLLEQSIKQDPLLQEQAY